MDIIVVGAGRVGRALGGNLAGLGHSISYAVRDLTRSETAVASAVAAIILVIGVYPSPVMNVTGASVAALTQRLDASAEARSRQAVAATPSATPSATR